MVASGGSRAAYWRSNDWPIILLAVPCLYRRVSCAVCTRFLIGDLLPSQRFVRTAAKQPLRHRRSLRSRLQSLEVGFGVKTTSVVILSLCGSLLVAPARAAERGYGRI